MAPKMAQTAPEPTAADWRAEIESRLADGDAPGSLAAAQTAWRATPDGSLARFIKSRLHQFWREDAIVERRVAFLRSFTLEPVIPFLEAEATLAGCRLAPWVGEFNAYGQEILDRNGALYAHRPDIVVLAVQARDLCPALWSGIADLSEDDRRREIHAAAGLMESLLDRLRSATSADLIVHGLEHPAAPSEGLLDLRRSPGQIEALAAINTRLRQWCAANAGTYYLDYDGLQAQHGRSAWLDERKWAAVKLPLSSGALPHLAQAWWRYIAALALPQAKVLALDLDNTVWGGIVGEDGMSGLQLGGEAPGVFYQQFQRTLLDIARRGVLLTIVSKNNPDDALQVIDQHPSMLIRRDHLAGMRINWEPKSDNLISLAKELNLDLSSFVFVDDNAVECEAVRRALPQVQVVELPADPSSYAGLVRSLQGLERLSLSSEDAERVRYYKEEHRRKEDQTKAESVEGFLQSLEIKVEVRPITPMTLTRAAQLTQKTNQLNLTTRRYAEAELAALLEAPGWTGYTLEASDRFGSNGVVGVAITRSDGGRCEIDTFLLSCRVIGRGLETAFLAALAQAARQAGDRELAGWFKPTTKNAPAAKIYSAAGFVLERRDGAYEWWRTDITEVAPTTPQWIELVGKVTAP